MRIDFLREVFRERSSEDAFVFRGQGYSYAWLLDQIDSRHDRLAALAVMSHSVVMLHADFSPHAIATLLSLMERGDTILPIAPSSESASEEFARIAGVDFHLRLGENGEIQAESHPSGPKHALYRELASRGSAGLVLFSSGTTGEAKGVVHDFDRLLEKYRRRRKCYRTLAFLLFDHIGGVDTVLYSLSNGSCLVFVDDRSPAGVCRAIQEHRVEVLPAAPTFLNLLFISGTWQSTDLSSLKIVTYGAEVMPEATLRRCQEMFIGVELMQKYGTSEVGTLRSKSRSSGSLWVKIGGEGYATRVVGGLLQIKAESSMLGYLNAESPFTSDGWFRTGDLVETDGDYIRFLGRDSDLINVGGRKVYPAEVESVIAGLPNVEEVVVFGEENALMGQVVCALVRTMEQEESRDLQRRVRAACRERLEKYKVPMKVEATDQALTTERFKRLRASPDGN
jgi:acyl-CoA synthetase (AMP-forming)/AMP-acid ligase II